MKSKSYQEAQEYILNIPKFTKKNSLDHTRKFLSYLGNPQENFRVIHVAGTNGKGSVCKYLEAMLLAEGETCGMFVSPHLISMNERILINGQMISKEYFAALFEKVLEAVEKMKLDGLSHPTFFEFLFGMAMLGFFESGIEIVVLETGLGGRLDATNVIANPLACIITSIGKDHVEFLGNTLGEIAKEKAGIIKKEVPVIYADTQEESSKVIEKKAQELGCRCKKIGKDAYEILQIQDKYIAFSCTNAYYENVTWRLHNTGVYQPENAMLAMEAMKEIFGKYGHPHLWKKALEDVIWEGRMEEVLPNFYVDGAHNLSAIEGFVQSVSNNKNNKILLFSVVGDKNYREMIQVLCKKLEVDFYLITEIEDARAAQVDELKKIFEEYTDKPVLIRRSLKEALLYLQIQQGERTVYCVGSLYLTGMIKAIIREDLLC